MAIHVNHDNIKDLLVGVMSKVKQKIDSIDLTDQQKLQLSLIDKIIKTGTGTKFLSDNGTYKNIPLDQMSNMTSELSVIYDLFKISYNKGDVWSTNYNNTPTSRYDFGCVQYNGKIYCIGGYNTNYLNSVESYDILSNTWSTNYNSMPTARYGFGCVQYNGKIYCIGGCSSSGYNNNIEVYDIISNTWSNNYNTMPTTRMEFGCIEYNGKIYCIGGNGSNNKVEVYDISSNTWSTDYNIMPTARRLFGCIEYDGKIYCIGGYGISSNKVEVYDISSNTWDTNYSTMPTSRYAFGCVEYNGKIYCIGGYNTTYLDNVEIYDISSNTWSNNYNFMPTKRQKFGCIYFDNKIYCISGSPINNKVEVYDIGYLTYDLTLPSIIQDKLSLLITNGTGNKLLTDNGTYQEYIPSGYREMNNDELSSTVSYVLSSIGW